MADYKDEIKGLADEYVGDLKGTVGEIAGDTKGAIKDVKDEAKEVIAEAKAAIKGQKLDSANEAGGAGYRADSSTNNGTSYAALVLGILAIILSFSVPLLGLIIGAGGTLLGAKARKQSQTVIATAGFACSAIAVIIAILKIIF